MNEDAPVSVPRLPQPPEDKKGDTGAIAKTPQGGDAAKGKTTYQGIPHVTLAPGEISSAIAPIRSDDDNRSSAREY